MTRWTFLRGVAFAAFIASLSAAHAREPLQFDPMEQARTAEARRDPAEALSRYLRALAANPRRFDALMGAGRTALAIGDANAALGFYARAEEVEPRNGAVKAGLGSALVQMEQPRPALRMFDDAIDLGVPPALVASDRGLAYDLRGDNDRAQKEYALALRGRDDPETARRLALSLAISGKRDAALQTLDPLLRRQDIAAWRARAFILAMTGDPIGAERAAHQVMPRLQADALAPFLKRLPALKPAQKAAAVHFGHFPSSGRNYGDAELFADAAPARTPRLGGPDGADKGLIPQGTPLGRSAEASEPVPPVPKAPRRRPGATDGAPSPGALRLDVLPPSTPQPMKLPARAAAPAQQAEPAKRLTIEPGFDFMADTSATAKPKPVTLAQASPPREAPREEKPAAPKTSEKAAAKADPKARTALAGKERDKAAADEKGKKDSKKADAEEPAKSRVPERYWVQVAGGARKADLPRAYANLKEKWPKQLSGRTPHTMPLRATNRLLIGPFKTAREAQDWVNEASKSGFASFTYTSPAGVEVEKLSLK